MPNEPHDTALALAILGALLALSVWTSRVSTRVPVALVFLAIGMGAGLLGLHVPFDPHAFAFRVGTGALVLILFDGGLHTHLSTVKEAIKPAAVLATLGVVVTAGIMAGCATLLGMPWKLALLLGAIVSSTDAAAIFSVLRGNGIHLRKRVGAILELESGLNDPMAMLLTIALTAFVVEDRALDVLGLVLGVCRELGLGFAVGLVAGMGGRVLLGRVRLTAAGLYPVLTTSFAAIAFGGATLVHGSGFLAVYVTAVVLGNATVVPYRAGLWRVHDALAWFAQVGMFLLLGLLVRPRDLIDVAGLGLALGLALAFVARPLAVMLSLVPFRLPWSERGYLAWVGLRGAVPIILATYPVMAEATGALRVFHLVFFIVVVNAFIPGTTVRWVTSKLRLLAPEPPAPQALLEVSSTLALSGKVIAFFVDKASAAAGVAIADLPFPDGAGAMLVVRGSELVAPRGDVVLVPGDHLYVVTRPDDEPQLRLLLGQQEEL